MDQCQDHGTKVHTKDLGLVDIDDDPLVAQMFGMMAQSELKRITRRNRDVIAVRRARGEILGHANWGWKFNDDRSAMVPNPDEPVDRLIQLFKDNQRNYSDTARALTAEGIPTRRGARWSGTSIRVILKREAPELLPAYTRQGAKPNAPFLLYQLLRCHCGNTMTARRTKGRLQVHYICSRAHLEPGHGRMCISEKLILDWIKAESTRWPAPAEQVEAATDNSAKMKALAARIVRVGDRYEAGEFEKVEYLTKVAKLREEMGVLEAASRALDIPEGVNWDTEGPRPWTTIEINNALRAMWEYVQLDEEMHPVRAQWTIDPGLLGRPR